MSKSTAEIRQTFLNFFEKKGHKIIPSSSLVPENDPTLLFTNAGMNQFKEVFLGIDKRDYSRATTAQRCVRAGGKHNDLENVGYTARHHTFFEMLGNFSFGDYFKEDAIQFAWELLTGNEWFNLPKERLWVTVYHTDDEAFDIWHKKMGLAKDRIIRIADNKGEKFASDNFWQMGDIGPCGPCTEIFYDHGEHILGGLPGSPDEDGDRYIEIWNIVFMQYNRLLDGTMQPLPKPSVDTGMGIERIAAVLQHVNSNYEIDIFQKLISDAAQILHVSDLKNKSLYVIADHIRSCTFLIADGVKPSNEGRGYVLRRILRRAIRHGNKLGAKEPFFYQLVDSVFAVMQEAAEFAKPKRNEIKKIIRQEEEQFIQTLERGLILLGDELSKLKGNILDGKIVFKLYDTYGFPVDLTADICREKNLEVDLAGFEKAMEIQRERARNAKQFNANFAQMISSDKKTVFIGYEESQRNARLLEIYQNGNLVDEIDVGDEAILIFDQTPFYAESGGQISDLGKIFNNLGTFDVLSVQKQGNVIIHQGKVISGKLKINQEFNLKIDENNREKIRRNHSATHLLHAALRQFLGNSVEQKGSLVSPLYLRFDFLHNEGLTDEQLKAIEICVNEKIRENLLIKTEEMSLEAAKEKGAMALFGEKYNTENVRVLSMGNFSIELCGGTHANRTGDIGLFRILSESGIAAGIRRIEAVTGDTALQSFYDDEKILSDLAKSLKSEKRKLPEKIAQLQKNLEKNEQNLQNAEEKQIKRLVNELVKNAIKINDCTLLVSEVEWISSRQLTKMIDLLKEKLGNAVIILASVDENQRIALVSGVSKSLIKNFSAGELIKALSTELGGNGGGKPEIAMGSGVLINLLQNKLHKINESLISELKKYCIK